MKNGVQFKIKGLNQEKNLNILAKKFPIYDIVRVSKNCSIFKVNIFHAKKVRKILIDLNYEILEEKRLGALPVLLRVFNIYTISAIIFSTILIFAQSPYIWQYEILGEENISKTEVVSFIKDNFTKNKYKLNTKSVEGALYEEYEEISFVSVIVRGQTLIVNIKEKLLPEEIYGDFKPIISEYDGKVTGINLISGTMAVKTGDYIKAGDVLVYPYYNDAGTIKKVMANAEITMEIYHTSSITHFEDRIELVRTGRSSVNTEVLLFNLPIYSNIYEMDYKLYETETNEQNLISNNILPLKLKRTTYYELEEVKIHETFEEAKDRLLKEAREKALLNAGNCDIIKDEYYTVEESTNTTINYCIVEEIKVGGYENRGQNRAL